MSTERRATVTLPTGTQVVITRQFDAPRHLVFRAWTTPELVRRWWAGDRGTVTDVRIDLRPGGTWRYVMTANAGFEVAFHGEYLEVVPDERLVSTEVYEGVPDATCRTTATFAEEDGVTTLTIVVDHTSKANRDTHVESGMEDGMQGAMRHLEAVAASLR